MPFLHDRSDFFVSELNLVPSSRVSFDTAIEVALCAKTFPPNGVTGIAAVIRSMRGEARARVGGIYRLETTGTSEI